MSNFSGFEPSNTTPVPDILFDELLSELSGSELKVLLYIIRRTRGFKKDTDAISLSQFQNGIVTNDGRVLDKGCGLNRETICKALKSLEDGGYIKSEKSTTHLGDNAVTVYSIRFKGDVVEKSNQGSRKSEPQKVVGKSAHGSRKKSMGVVGKSDPQQTVIQETVKQQTVIKEERVDREPFAPIVAPSSPSQSSSFFSEAKPQEKTSSKKKTEPLMPPQDAPWPSRETAVQIVEAKKGRIYSDTTRKQELGEASKILEMTVDNALITREQFESAWDELASSSWWDEHGKPCMLKYLRRDDTIVGIVKKLKRKGKPSSNTQVEVVDMEADRERARIKNEQQLQLMRERRRKREEALKVKGVQQHG